ncbi:rho guanine nucleotide exchange factor 16-like [Scleropages formosus]|uniref:Rho guanine nucleotide exchange factor 16-like n=1 Tax=Scleropages formosus TaxID=113540 RepID=A0A0N8K1T3_SCLFO|nr:rho guanine nucleotide exchange factor 16-like [Scleropages formosus]
MPNEHEDEAPVGPPLTCKSDAPRGPESSGGEGNASQEARGEPRTKGTVVEACDGRSSSKVVLSTQSKVALKLGTQQLIPKNLAVTSRTKTRHHTTVVTLPVQLQSNTDKRVSAPPSDVSWEDYDSDGEGGSLQRNRRNKSYRAAVRFLTNDDMAIEQGTNSLNTVKEEGSPITQRDSNPRHSKASSRTLRRRKNRKHKGSFKDDGVHPGLLTLPTVAEPRLYQEIRERGLNSNNQSPDDELLDNSPVEPPEPDQGIVVKNYRAAHLSWSQLPQVQETGILLNITSAERKRQEAIFEVITSEYSYQHSLNILVRQFKANKDLRCTMTATEHHHLFSNIADIQAASQRFFEDLERRHRENPLIQDISDIVQEHATRHFQPYIIYCSNETFQLRVFQKLLAKNEFKEVLKKIEMSPECGGLPMISFLILPMQRVTRLPLLMDTICQKTPENTAEYFSAAWALKAISKLVKKCNEGARNMERTEQLCTIQKQLDFGKIKPFPLISSSRWLQKSGELAICTEELSIFSKAFSAKSYYLFLFNDVLIVTRKKSEESYVVMDYATLENLEVELDRSDGQVSPPVKQNSLYSFRLRMKKNCDGRAEHIGLVAESQVDRARWITALQRHKRNDDTINKEDLPQYEVTQAYLPKEPDELGLQQAEVVIVLQAKDDWYQGERMRDGQQGWFLSSCVTEITNRAAVASNMRRMERLRKETNV